MKYIMLEVDHGNGFKVRYPVIFPDHLVHADVASALIWGSDDLQKATVTSAGFCSSLELAADYHGRSVSLGVDSDPGDSAFIRMRDYNAGIV